MRTVRCQLSGVAALACLASVAAGCTDTPVAPDRTTISRSLAASAGVRASRHIALLKDGKMLVRALGTEAVKLGAVVERAHSEIGVLTVRGLSEAAATRLAARPDVEAVVRDRTVQWLPSAEQRFRVVRLPAGVRPERDQRDAVFFEQFQWNLRRIRADNAWLVTNQGRGTIVCILDSGVDPRHIDLTPRRFNFDVSASFVANESAIRDLNLHGTAIASIVTTRGIGIASVAPEARVCSIKVLSRTGSGTFGDLIAGIYYAGLIGVDVANMSFGVDLPRNDPEIQALIKTLQRAVNFATRRGVLFVASAGDAGLNLNTGDLIHIPAQLNNVVSVGATGPIKQRHFDRLAPYSNRGRQGVDVFGPGGQFEFPGNVIEDLIMRACSPSNMVPGFEFCRRRDGYLLGAGTSEAAAHVSGEAAVIESELPGDQTPAELTACLLQSADPLPNPFLTANGRINVLRGARCSAAKGAGAVTTSN